MKSSYFFFLLILLVGCHNHSDDLSTIFVDPVFTVDVPAPTADKPQSKIWFAYDAWWALLPTSSGPSLWKRSENGWLEQNQFNDELLNQPGKADVFHGDELTIAILVKECDIKSLRLIYSDSLLSYIPQPPTSLTIPKDCQSIETATLAKDGKGMYWVASDMNNSIMVWSSMDGINWSDPHIITENINEDDICTIAVVPNGVSVIWSNQDQEAVYESIHYNSHPEDQWSETKTIDIGNKTADDHLNTTLLDDGTLILVSKNSLDEIDRPQFVLRIRDVNEKWTNIPYANLTAYQMPTRPVVTRTLSGEIIELHSVKNVESKDYHISFSIIEKMEADWLVREIFLVKARKNSTVNDVTVSKESFSENAAWIVLFSDIEGNVFEINLKQYLK